MNIRTIRCILLAILLSILIVCLAAAGCASAGHKTFQPIVVVASTTSLCDSGLWEYLEPLFETKYEVDLRVLCVGTGVAMRYGQKGDVDVLIVHDQGREEQFVSEGYGDVRMPFTCNRFLVVGPGDDPAGIRGLKIEAAFARLAVQSNAIFISRGDESGTHVREKEIWQGAGVDYQEIRKSQWYVETGTGMGSTLQLASEKRGYTLADSATFLTFRRKLDIVPLVGEGEAMLNIYSIITVSPERCPGVNYQAAKLLVEFLVSQEVQALLKSYGVRDYGEPLFFPYCDCQR